jgi:hypothetical protein
MVIRPNKGYWLANWAWGTCGTLPWHHGSSGHGGCWYGSDLRPLTRFPWNWTEELPKSAVFFCPRRASKEVTLELPEGRYEPLFCKKRCQQLWMRSRHRGCGSSNMRLQSHCPCGDPSDLLRFKFINGNTFEQAEEVPESCSEVVPWHAVRDVYIGCGWPLPLYRCRGRCWWVGSIIGN